MSTKISRRDVFQGFKGFLIWHFAQNKHGSFSWNRTPQLLGCQKAKYYSSIWVPLAPYICRAGCSFMCRSICDGIKLLRLGIRQSSGEGRSILAWGALQYRGLYILNPFLSIGLCCEHESCGFHPLSPRRWNFFCSRVILICSCFNYKIDSPLQFRFSG